MKNDVQEKEIKKNCTPENVIMKNGTQDKDIE